MGRFGNWFDAELEAVEDLLDICGHEDAIDGFEMLRGLHLEAEAGPQEIRRPLKRALDVLERLLVRLRSIRPRPAAPAIAACIRRTDTRRADTAVVLDRALAC